MWMPPRQAAPTHLDLKRALSRGSRWLSSEFLATPRCALAPTATPALARVDGLTFAAASDRFHFFAAASRSALLVVSSVLLVSCTAMKSADVRSM